MKNKKSWLTIPTRARKLVIQIAAVLAAVSSASQAQIPSSYIYAAGSSAGVTATDAGGGIIPITVSSSIGDEFPGFAFGQSYGEVHGSLLGGSYSASVDVRAGTLRARVHAPNATVIPDIPYYYGSAHAGTAFSDAITVHGDFSRGPVELTISAHLEGSLVSGPSLPESYPFPIGPDYGYTRVNFSFGGSFGGMPPYEVVHRHGQSPTLVDETFEIPITLSGSSQTQGVFQLGSGLTVEALDGSLASFGGTASITLNLPPGYTHTSELGFLTAVPEPEHYTLAASIGLLGVAMWRRRRNRARHGLKM